jgi:hypothetical protein
MAKPIETIKSGNRLAEMLSVSPKKLLDIQKTPGFPAPIRHIEKGVHHGKPVKSNVYLLSDIKAWQALQKPDKPYKPKVLRRADSARTQYDYAAMPPIDRALASAFLARPLIYIPGELA